MELQERINVLTQGAELAQKAGALTLDDAYIAKKAIDAIKQNVALKEAMTILVQTAEKGQKKGSYTLRDAHLLYLASENFESSIPMPAPQPIPVQQDFHQTQGQTGDKGGPGDPGTEQPTAKR